MSMLSLQVDNLRLMARLVRDYDYKEISRMLREAADTIEKLGPHSDQLEPSRWHELFGTPERAARTLVDNCEKPHFCEGCLADTGDHDCTYDALLEWLRGDA